MRQKGAKKGPQKIAVMNIEICLQCMEMKYGQKFDVGNWVKSGKVGHKK